MSLPEGMIEVPAGDEEIEKRQGKRKEPVGRGGDILVIDEISDEFKNVGRRQRPGDGLKDLRQCGDRIVNTKKWHEDREPAPDKDLHLTAEVEDKGSRQDPKANSEEGNDTETAQEEREQVEEIEIKGHVCGDRNDDHENQGFDHGCDGAADNDFFLLHRSGEDIVEVAIPDFLEEPHGEIALDRIEKMRKNQRADDHLAEVDFRDSAFDVEKRQTPEHEFNNRPKKGIEHASPLADEFVPLAEDDGLDAD